jgi:hypothetical protein
MKFGPIVAPNNKIQNKNTSDIVTDQFGLDQKSNDNKNNQQSNGGMSIMELMRIKQNEEIDLMIENQLSEINTTSTD